MKKSSPATWIPALLFLATVGSAWAWFHVGVRPPEKSYRLHTRAHVEGYRYKDLPVGEQAVEILATTNLVNGVFEGAGEDRFIVFAANWQPRGAKGMSVISHTPEICWVGAGFSLMHLGEPAFMEVGIAGEKVPFECRVFRAPDKRSIEMVVWCSLLGGQWVEEGFRYQTDRARGGSGEDKKAENARIRGANIILRALRTRQPCDGSKQFVRFSTGVSGDWKDSYARLQRFAGEWLELQVTRN